VGVMIGPGRAFALLRDASQQEARAIALNGDFDGWRLTVIEPRRVVLHGKTGDLELRLQGTAARAGTITVAPPTSAGLMPRAALPRRPPMAVPPPGSFPVYLGPPGTNRRRPG